MGLSMGAVSSFNENIEHCRFIVHHRFFVVFEQRKSDRRKTTKAIERPDSLRE
jgi:hypothetical protein